MLLNFFNPNTMSIEAIINELKEGFRQIVREELNRTHRPPEPDITSDRINRTQAAKLANVSLPTFSKLVKAGTFPQHGFGPRNKFYLKSEIIESLKKQANEKENK
jgi:predicted DNA-binding transcriptional regulator AlpA